MTGNNDKTVDEVPLLKDASKKIIMKMIRRYESIGLLVDTSLEDGIYRTIVVCPKFADGFKTVLQRYASSSMAVKGHEYWVERFIKENYPSVKELTERFCDPQEVTDSVSISLKPLISILSTITSKSTSLLITKIPKSSHLRIWIPVDNQWTGMCKYDTTNRIAYQISPVWYNLIQQTKAEISDRASPIDNRGLQI